MNTRVLPENSAFPVGQINGTADDCSYPEPQRLVAYWRDRLPSCGGLPCWRDFNLMDLYEIALTLSVKDVIDGGADFRNRFWGTGLTNMLGFEGTGRLVSTYEPRQMRDTVMRRYRRVTETGESSMARGHIGTIPDKTHIFFELVHLPLSAGGDGVAHIISVYHFGV